MIFIATCSQDATTDLLLPFFDAANIFRFNVDQPKAYSWDFHTNGFRISTVSQQVTQSTLSAFYIRKPLYVDEVDIPKGGCLEDWRRKETEELFADFYRECESRGMTALVHGRNAKYGKLRQMLVAPRYFKIAPWHMFHGTLPEELRTDRWVAKMLTGTPIGKGKAFFVKEVDPQKLDLTYPWFLQKKISGGDEVTVVYIAGQLFAASVNRDTLDGDDVRRPTLENRVTWSPCELSPSEQSAIRGFMAETGYTFGRFDFIRKDGELWFLELNPNGQWAWLDPKNEHGLISMVADAIKEDDRIATARNQKRGQKF